MLIQSEAAFSRLGPDRGGLPPDKINQVLAARGMLAEGLLVHGLQKRHLVDYGVNRWDWLDRNTGMPLPIGLKHICTRREMT